MFTTRPETIFGATYIAVSHEKTDLLDRICRHSMAARNQVLSYREKIARNPTKSIDLDQMEPGQRLHGVHAIHPFTGAELPVFVASYVLADYGPGALMGVPMHDERDCAFALENNLTLIQVLDDTEERLVNSGDEFSGMPIRQGAEAILTRLEQIQQGKWATEYRLRDWLVSR